MNIIGLDIGGTKITGVVFNGKKVVRSLTIPTPKSLGSFTSTVKKLVETLCLTQKIDGIGIGMAGLVDRKKNTIIHSPNLKFIQNYDFSVLFPKIKKLRVDNDAKCFTRAELLLGQGKKHKNFVCLTLGTGIGGGLVFNGGLYLGSHGIAGEPGSMMLDIDQKIEEHYQKARDASNYKQVSKIVGVLLTDIYKLLDPEVVILGGGVAVKNQERFLPAVLEFLAKRFTHYPMDFKILISELEHAGAIGAALLLK